MANRIDHLLFWTGGVILPRLSQLAAGALPAGGGDPARGRRLADLERQLAQGEIAALEFCELAAAAAGAPGPVESLRPAILDGAKILPGMKGLLEELAPHVRLGLLSDYPRPWLETILAGSGLAHLFSVADIQYTAVWPGADLFDALTRENVIRPGRTLWVDYDSVRATRAVRRGIDVALCVDARRLRRDLGLWGLVRLDPL